MKRTAADFAKESKEPYELEMANGKVLRPKATVHFTHDERMRATRTQLKWAKASEAGDLLDYPEAEMPFFVDLELRFGKDFKAFWAEAKTWRFQAISDLIQDVEEYYDPTPADEDADEDSEAGKGRLSSVGS